LSRGANYLIDPNTSYSIEKMFIWFFTVVVFIPIMEEAYIPIESVSFDENLYVGLNEGKNTMKFLIPRIG